MAHKVRIEGVGSLRTPSNRDGVVYKPVKGSVDFYPLSLKTASQYDDTEVYLVTDEEMKRLTEGKPMDYADAFDKLDSAVALLLSVANLLKERMGGESA